MTDQNTEPAPEEPTDEVFDPDFVQQEIFEPLGMDLVAQPALAAAGVRAWEKGGDTFFFTSKFPVAPEARLGER